MRNEINLTDEQIEERFEALGFGLCVEDLVFTRETISDYLAARATYNERGSIQEQGEGFVVLIGVQVAKGQPRRDVAVVDFGSVRAIYC